ncbi:hypothetical protein KJ966_21235 [bacterium]|nr:hypothetical protein [bacterium]
MEYKPVLEIVFYKDQNYFLIKAIGNLNVQDITANLKEVFGSQNYKTGMNGLWDLSKADLYDLTPESVAILAEEMMELAENAEKTLAAIVSEKSINLGLINLFTEHFQNDHTEIKVFDCLNDAIQWITQPVTTARKTSSLN